MKKAEADLSRVNTNLSQANDKLKKVQLIEN